MLNGVPLLVGPSVIGFSEFLVNKRGRRQAEVNRACDEFFARRGLPMYDRPIHKRGEINATDK